MVLPVARRCRMHPWMRGCWSRNAAYPAARHRVETSLRVFDSESEKKKPCSDVRGSGLSTAPRNRAARSKTDTAAEQHAKLLNSAAPSGATP